MESNDANKFANILKKHSTEKPRSLYHKKHCQNKTDQYSLKDALLGVAKQLKDIQGADNDKRQHKQKNDLSFYKKNDFIPINMMIPDQPTEQVTNNFETQYELDTQLYNLMVKAEALIDEPKDADTFNHLDVDDKHTNNTDDGYIKDTYKIDKAETIQTAGDHSSTTKDDGNLQINTVNIDKSTNIQNISNNSKDFIGSSDRNRLSNNSETKNSSSDVKETNLPLVYELELFERFETLASQVINNNPDIETAKKIINSQIMNRELFIQAHADPLICDRDKSLSPILKIHNPRNTIKKEISNSKNVSIADEILFSSDEENDYKNNLSKLPITCDVTMPVNDQPDLNKTMYVGFQTASNKSIQVNTDSYTNAKSILDNVKTSEDVSLVKLVEAFDSNTNNIDTNEVNDKNYDLYKAESFGFKTALGKAITISKDGLIKSKRVFEDIFDNDKDVNIDNFAKKYKKSLITSNESNIDMINMKSLDKLDKSDNNCQPVHITKEANEIPHSYTGGTDKLLSMDPELLYIDEYIIKEFENNFTNENNNNLELETTKNSNDGKFVNDVNIIESFERPEINQIKSSDIHDGFYNPVDTDENKENSTKNLNYYNQPSTSKNLIGFRTANNNNITVSKQALAKTKHIFDDIDEENMFPITEHTDKQPLNINNKPLDPINTKNKKHGFINPFSRTKISSSYKMCEESNKLDINCRKSSFIGFQTASNKPVEISKLALAKSERMFEEICNNSENKKLENNFNSKVSKGGFNIDSEYKTKESFNHRQDLNLHTGFKTASNKSVKISDEALNDNIETCYNNVKINTKSNLIHNTIEGFKTASNKRVSISNEALAKTKNVFNDIEFDNSEYTFKNHKTKGNGTDSTNLNGFKTASNKPVKISAEALSRSKKIFQDIETIENQKTNSEQNNVTESVFKGFKTASNKKVEISDEALAQSRNLLREVINEKTNESAFVGFHTANNKSVKISEEALEKSKKLLEDLNIDRVLNVKKAADYKPKVNHDFGFKTANNNNVSVSEESLKISRKFLDSNNENLHKKVEEVVPEYTIDIEDLINTEVIKNLEESLCTEDFRSDRTPVSKRSGSPILSCPSLKKRKFKTPKSTIKIDESNKIETAQSNNIFRDGYKVNKKYTLKDLKNMETNSTKNSESNINFNLDDLIHAKFDGTHNDIDSDVWTTDKIKKYFTDSVNKKIIPEGWIDNHLKLIIWKLLSYEIVFPKCMKDICTIKNVLCQLKYRYDRELYNVERPALRKVLEKDEVPSKMIVLCVAGVNADGINNCATNTTQNIELLMTDGWYCVKACGDGMICKLICDGKIRVGTKLVIHGAELLNCEQGISPWEDTSTVRLKIFGNSTRRARWDARLGFHGTGAILSPLSAVRVEGGKVSRLRVLVTRIYPTLYVEKFEDGSTVTRSERLEHQHQMKYESDRQNEMEKLYDELEKISDKESQDSEGFDSDRGNLDSGSQIYRYVKRNTYSTDYKTNLTETQINQLNQYTEKKREKLVENLQKNVQELMKKRGLDAVRNVVPLVKIRIADACGDKISKAMLTIWRPNEYLLELIKEGVWLDIYNVVPTAYRLSELQISAGRQSIFKKSKLNTAKIKTHADILKRKCYHIQELQTTTTTDYNEIDTMGFIFLIDTTNQYQNVFFADENKNMISVNFWGGIKKFGFENILDTGQIVACVNLQSRSGNTKKIIPQYRATEFTYFTKTCKIDAIRKLTEDYTKKFSSINKKEFIEDCIAIKNNFTIKHGNTEAHRLNTSDNRYKVLESVETNLYLAGLDLDSFTGDLLSPKSMLRKKKVKEKLDKLKQYGEPPPLNLIHINNSKTIQPYKSPLCKSDSNNVTSINNNKTPNVANFKNVNSSPVLNTTYVKSINPVKLNFCDNEENITDPFAEEFNYSPPLSF